MPAVGGSDDLQRFVTAQQSCYDTIRAELRRGRKQSHWIWFIFPQLTGLGFSPNATHFGIRSRAEARNYLSHPVLGARLRECVRLLLAVPAGRTIESILGPVDALKVRSSMTLFAETAPDDESRADFQEVLDRFYGGAPDERTLEILKGL